MTMKLHIHLICSTLGREDAEGLFSLWSGSTNPKLKTLHIQLTLRNCLLGRVFGAVTVPPPGEPRPYVRVQGSIPGSSLHSSSLLNAYHRRQPVMVQVGGCLLPTQDAWIEFWMTGFRLHQPHLLWAFGEWIGIWEISVCLSNKINKNVKQRILKVVW